MKPQPDHVAAITGAASGIGRALALELARRGCRLALADVNAEALAETASAAAQAAPGTLKVTTQVVDVADRDAVFAWAARVKRDHGHVNFLFNNAGVALAAPMAHVKIEDFEWIMGINFWGVVHGTQAFLPLLKASGAGHVVNISSLFGLMAVPTQGAYNASKFAVRGFTEALRMELELEGAPVSATCVHPGGVATHIAKASRVDERILDLTGETPDLQRSQADALIQATTPESAALQILAGVSRDERRVLVGADAKVMDLLVRLLGSSYQWLVVKRMRQMRSATLALAAADSPPAAPAQAAAKAKAKARRER